VLLQPPSPSLKFITAIKTKEEWDEQVMKAPTTTLCVCDIYAEWCGPCVSLNKRLANLSGDFIECVRRLFDHAHAFSDPLAFTILCSLHNSRLPPPCCFAPPVTISNGAR